MHNKNKLVYIAGWPLSLYHWLFRMAVCHRLSLRQFWKTLAKYVLHIFTFVYIFTVRLGVGVLPVADISLLYSSPMTVTLFPTKCRINFLLPLSAFWPYCVVAGKAFIALLLLLHHCYFSVIKTIYDLLITTLFDKSLMCCTTLRYTDVYPEVCIQNSALKPPIKLLAKKSHNCFMRKFIPQHFLLHPLLIQKLNLILFENRAVYLWNRPIIYLYFIYLVFFDE